MTIPLNSGKISNMQEVLAFIIFAPIFTGALWLIYRGITDEDGEIIGAGIFVAISSLAVMLSVTL